VRHATPAALDELDGLLASLRALPGLTEKKRGTFYRGSKAFLHFHEDGDDMYADVRLTDDFVRRRVTSAVEQDALVAEIQVALSSPP